MAGLIDGNVAARRQEPRYDMSVRAELRAYGMAPLSATMLDISASGAMLRAETEGLLVGDEVILVLGEVHSVATIVWLRDEACGITFHRRLNPFTLDTLRRMTRH
jgi:PilZ domain